MKTVKGVVTWVGDRKKYGNYSFKLEGHDQWFRSPNRAEGLIEAGYKIAVKVEENERGDYDVKAKPKLIKKGKPPAKGGKGGYRGGRGGYKPDPEKDKRITAQHSQEMALVAASLIITQGGIKLGAQNKPDARKTQILELVDELAVKFFKDAYDFEGRVGEKAEEVEDDLDDEGDDVEEESEDEVEDDADEDGDDSKDEDFDDDVPWDKDDE